MKFDTANHYEDTGLPKSKEYLEKGLPSYLVHSLEVMKRYLELLEQGGQDLHWDAYWCELNADINVAENEQRISKEQAWYLRRTYLGMEEPE